MVRGALGVVLDQVRREPLDGVRGSFLHERRHAVEQHGHDGRVEIRPNGQGLDVHGVLDVVVGLQGRGDVGRIRGLDLRDGGGGFVAVSRRVSCVCFVAATASRGRPCRARGPSFLRFRAVSRRRASAVSRGAAAGFQRWRGASGAGADSVMSVGFSSSAISSIRS